MNEEERSNVVLADCPPEEIYSLLEGLNSLFENKFRCFCKIACGLRKGIWSDIKRYRAYFVAAWSAFKKRGEYNIVIGWQQFYALIFCFYCNLFHVKKNNTVVALNFTYRDKKGIVGKVYAKFFEACLKGGYLDYIHVLSSEYAAIISNKFNFSLDRIIVTPFGVDDIYYKWKNSNSPLGDQKNNYAMSIGRSNRDFELLINVWKRIDFPLVIISDTFATSNPLPDNVKLIDNVAGDEQYPYIANAKMVVIPIKDGRICSGDTVLLTSLSFEKTVIVTSPSTLGEMYIKDGENGYIVEKDSEKMVSLIQDIISGKKSDLGKKARESYLSSFSRYSMGKKIAEKIRNGKTGR